jgi:hypothetical protein
MMYGCQALCVGDQLGGGGVWLHQKSAKCHGAKGRPTSRDLEVTSHHRCSPHSSTTGPPQCEGIYQLACALAIRLILVPDYSCYILIHQFKCVGCKR